MIKYNNVHVRRCFLTTFMILFLLTSVVAKTRIMLISDPHVMGPGLLIKKGDAWEDAIYYDRKLTEYTRDIYDEMIAVALREKPDLFLISGDLTKDGEMVSHEYVAEKLQLLKQAGIKPFVIPGNHDLGTDEACYYDGGYCDNVLEVADANSFAELYRDFGYGDDVERDEHSLSWSCEPVEGLVLIGLDTGQDDTELNGCISEFTIGWLFNQAMDAKQRGKQVIVMMHHSLFPHIVKVDECNATYSVRLAMKMLNDDAYIYHDYTYVLGRLAYAGVPVVFSGHVHASDIAKDVMSGSSVFDISTASCASFPNPYRMLTLSDDFNTMRIQTYRITELPGLDNFAALSEERMNSGLKHLVWDNTHNEEFCDLFADLFKVHVMGNEPYNPRQKEFLDMYEENLPQMKEDHQINEYLNSFDLTFDDLTKMVYSVLEDKSNYGNPERESLVDDLDTTISLDGSGWTGVRSLVSEKTADGWYNLQGQRMAKPLRKGIYIHGGKLSVVR